MPLPENKPKFDPTREFNPVAYVEDMKVNNPEKYNRLWQRGLLIGAFVRILIIIALIAILGWALVHLIRSH